MVLGHAVPVGNYMVANNGDGTVTAQHNIVALEVRSGPEVACDDILCKPTGRYGIRLKLGQGGGEVWANGTLRKIDKRR